MPAPLHPAWAHFRRDATESLYRTDKDHKAAWCKGCLASKVAAVQASEGWQHTLDPSKSVCSTEQIENQRKYKCIAYE